jgi:hypothetical protein
MRIAASLSDASDLYDRGDFLESDTSCELNLWHDKQVPAAMSANHFQGLVLIDKERMLTQRTLARALQRSTLGLE